MLSEAWARAAARSLTSQSFNAGVHDAALDENAYETWLSALLPTTRAAHRLAHGTTTAPGAPFLVGGEYLSYPGDPNGSAENTIGCQCIVVPSFDPSNIATALTPEEIEERLLGSRYNSRMVTAAVHGEFTGAIVSLLPSEEDAVRLAVDGFEPPESLHVTLTWLGDTSSDAAEQPTLTFEETCDRVREVVRGWGGGGSQDRVEAGVFAVATFNPGSADPDRDPATVLLVQSATLLDLRTAVVDVVGDASSFPIWVPHITLGYNLGESAPAWDVNERTGPVVFDRLAVCYGSKQVEVIELGEVNEPRNLTATAMRRELVGSKLPPLRFLSANIRAATLVDIPAFPDARIALVGEIDESGMQAWEGSIAFTRIATGDARVYEKFTWGAVPLPLRWAQEDEGWHMGAQVVGRIDEISQDGDAIVGRGVIDTTWPPGAAVVTLIDKQMCGGVSVDMDEVDIDEDSLLKGDEPDGVITASVIGDTDLPIADRDMEWDGAGAETRVFDRYTDADGNVDVGGVSKAFLYRDDDADPTTKSAYKLGFADVVNGQLQIVPRGVFATAGGRGVESADIPNNQKEQIRSRICTLYERLRAEFDDDSIVCPFDDVGADDAIVASAYAALQALKPMPREWFQEPVDLPQDKGSTFFEDGRVYGWVARRGVPHEVLGRTPPLDDVDLTTFLRRSIELDDGSQVRVGAFTMDVGHHRDGAECETDACQFDDTRTVAGIVTVGVNEGGMWFSGAAAPWLSEWDRHVFLTCQPSGHWRYENRGWSLRAVLTVPVPGFPTPLAASAVVHRANTALRSMPTPHDDCACVQVTLDPTQLDEIAASVVGCLSRRTERDALSRQVRAVAAERLEEQVHGVRTLR